LCHPFWHAAKGIVAPPALSGTATLSRLSRFFNRKMGVLPVEQAIRIALDVV
jgi:hypothetical protein